MQSFTQFMKMYNNTWIEIFGSNTTRQHDPWDALYGYDSMWLGALALDLAEAKLQNMTPSLTLGDFQYTGENSTIIKDAIYNSALKVTFTGASVSDHACTTYELKHYIHKHYIYHALHENLSSSIYATGLCPAPPQW